MQRMTAEEFRSLANVGWMNDAAHERIAASLAMLDKVYAAATQWPRCCDLWQDSLGGMHCNNCSKKTFAMFRNVQQAIGVGKNGKPEAPDERKNSADNSDS